MDLEVKVAHHRLSVLQLAEARSYAFGFLRTGKLPECVTAVVHNDVLPFYQDRGLTVSAILTDNGREYCGTEAHRYEIYLALNDIEHRRTKVRHPQTNGFAERLSRAARRSERSTARPSRR